MTLYAVKVMTSCLIALMISGCQTSGLVRGTGYQHSELPRAGAKLLIDNGYRRSVEIIASNDDQCEIDKGCLKHEPE